MSVITEEREVADVQRVRVCVCDGPNCSKRIEQHESTTVVDLPAGWLIVIEVAGRDAERLIPRKHYCSERCLSRRGK